MELQLPIVDKMLKQNNCLDLLREHHVAGLFYNHFPDPLLPFDCLEQYKRQWIHNQIIMEVLESINTQAKLFKTNATILKGSHLLFDLYPDLGSRFLSDIDLLISKEDIEKWKLILTELNYKVIIQKTFHGNNFKEEWCKKIGDVEINIELHTKLFFHLEHESWQVECTPFSNIMKLRNEDFFIHLCGHLAFQHNFLKLYWLFDIYFFYKKYFNQMDWEYIKLKSTRTGLYRSVEMCLWIIKKYFAVTFDENIEKLFEINKKRWWNKLLTLDFLLYPLARKRRYFLLKHATKDQLTAALVYDLTWFFHYKVQKLWSK
jgi:hypothetical protein